MGRNAFALVVLALGLVAVEAGAGPPAPGGWRGDPRNEPRVEPAPPTIPSRTTDVETPTSVSTSTAPLLPKRREWMVEHQSADGAWNSATFRDHCIADGCDGGGGWDSPVGTTGLVLLAFTGYGETHRTPRYGRNVRDAARYLMERQDHEGRFDDPASRRGIQDHAIATLAIAELWKLTRSPLFRRPVWRAVSALLAARESDGTWRAGTGAVEGDAVTTAWAVLALASAREGDFKVPTREDLRRDLAWFLDAVTDPHSGRARVSLHAPAPTPRATAAVLSLRVWTIDVVADRTGCDRMAEALIADIRQRNRVPDVLTPEALWFATQACFQLGGDDWKQWNAEMKKAIIDRQTMDRTRCAYGSWAPLTDDPGGLGRIETTALDVKCLEVYYRCARVFGSRTAAEPLDARADPPARPAAAARRAAGPTRVHRPRRSILSANRSAALDPDSPEPRTDFHR